MTNSFAKADVYIGGHHVTTYPSDGNIRVINGIHSDYFNFGASKRKRKLRNGNND